MYRWWGARMGLPSSLIRISWSYNAARGTLLRDSFAVIDIRHQTLPRTRGGGTAPPGGRRRASRRLYSVRTPRGWLGPARSEFLAPNSPLGPPPVLLADFWAAGRARNPLNFVRWVVPIKARGRYALKAVCAALKAV
jgi:hypothetical protein